jgi:hypothetical protein
VGLGRAADRWHLHEHANQPDAADHDVTVGNADHDNHDDGRTDHHGADHNHHDDNDRTDDDNHDDERQYERQHEYEHQHGDADNHAAADPARRLIVARASYAHNAVVILDPDGDSRAPGGAITVALCGHWDHEPPCPLAPHNTDATPESDDTLRLRVLFAAEPKDERRVRELITQALSSGRLTGPDGRVTRWMLQSSCASSLRPDEADHAARLVAN